MLIRFAEHERKRLPWFQELKWLVAMRLLGWSLALVKGQASYDLVQGYRDVMAAFTPHPDFLTVNMYPQTVVSVFDALAAQEKLTDDPAKAKAVVIDEQGTVRLVVDCLFVRDGDTVHHCGERGFAEGVRYWRLQRSLDATRRMEIASS